MEEQVLTIEQMQELIELGVDISKASMCWWKGNRNTKDILAIYHPEDDVAFHIIPTFTLQDMLEMIPNYSICHYDTRIEDLDGYVITLKNGEAGLNFARNIHTERDVKLLDAAYNMLKWVKQNKNN